jgi:hypothetical protein
MRSARPSLVLLVFAACAAVAAPAAAQRFRFERALDVAPGPTLSAVEISFESNARMLLDTTSRSGDVRLDGFTVDGSRSKGRVTGAVGGGGPTVRLASRSGSIRIGR